MRDDLLRSGAHQRAVGAQGHGGVRAVRQRGGQYSRELVLDAVLVAVRRRRPNRTLIHSDQGTQYQSIRYTERLAEVGVEPSVGSVGDSYDNAMAESAIGLFKAEVIYARGPWRNFEVVEYATLELVDCFNNRRLLEPIGHVPAAEFEEAYYRQQPSQAMAA